MSIPITFLAYLIMTLQNTQMEAMSFHFLFRRGNMKQYNILSGNKTHKQTPTAKRESS